MHKKQQKGKKGFKTLDYLWYVNIHRIILFMVWKYLYNKKTYGIKTLVE